MTYQHATVVNAGTSTENGTFCIHLHMKGDADDYRTIAIDGEGDNEMNQLCTVLGLEEINEIGELVGKPVVYLRHAAGIDWGRPIGDHLARQFFANAAKQVHVSTDPVDASLPWEKRAIVGYIDRSGSDGVPRHKLNKKFGAAIHTLLTELLADRHIVFAMSGKQSYRFYTPRHLTDDMYEKSYERYLASFDHGMDGDGRQRREPRRVTMVRGYDEGEEA